VKISIREALARGAALLQAAGIESARLDARILLSQALGIPSGDLFFAEATPARIEIFESLIRRRAAREPLAYITGRKEFWSLEFEVGPGVLIPRPETETLVEESLRRFPDTDAPLRVLDIGTGSGCLLIASLKERPNAIGLGIDSSAAALAYARRNAARHKLDDRYWFELVEAADAQSRQVNTQRRGGAGVEDVEPPRRQDAEDFLRAFGRHISLAPWRLGGFPSQLRDLAREFDLILANPPYLTDEEFAASAPEIINYEPRAAFAAGPDGLEGFRSFLPLVAASLSPGGMAFFEIGTGQVDKVSKIIMNGGLEVRHAVDDLSGIPRCLAIGRAGEGCQLAPLKNSVGKEPATR
jgi:release factor glutamine methyltransferase